MATQKQLAARRLFAARSRAGTLKRGKRKAKKRSPARRVRAVTTRKRRTVKTMARKKYSRRRTSRGFKLGKPLVRGGILAAFAGLGASMLAQRFVPNNPLVKYGAALIGGGTSGVIGTIGADVLSGQNPLAMLSGATAPTTNGVYGSGY